MRTIILLNIPGNARSVVCCIIIFAMLALVGIPLHPTKTESKNLQSKSGSTGSYAASDSAPALLPQKPPLDFDGDNKTDYAVVRNVSGTLTWFVQRSMLGFFAQAFGSIGDEFVPGDYDGDGKTDQAVWRLGASTFFVNRSTFGFTSLIFGTPNDFVPAFTLQAR